MNKIKLSKIEINGNLNCLKGYTNFESVVLKVYFDFCNAFGWDTISTLPLYIDNATKDSGYTPISIPVLKKIIIIKLGVSDFNNTQQIIFQFSHEMCHFVYYCLMGLDKPLANIREESICTAMSLCFINKYFTNIEEWCNYVKNLTNDGYRLGYDMALSVNFQMDKLRDLILNEVQNCNQSS